MTRPKAQSQKIVRRSSIGLYPDDDDYLRYRVLVPSLALQRGAIGLRLAVRGPGAERSNKLLSINGRRAQIYQRICKFEIT